MALPALETRTPTTIHAIAITLYSIIEDVEGVPTEQRRIRYKYTPADQFGFDLDTKNGDLVPHLTPEQIAALQSFMDDMRVLAEATLPMP